MKSFFKIIISKILELEARAVLKKYKPTIIAVTGSVGKTSTKDAIYSVLAPTIHVRKSDKSFNSEIGVPLTILGCQNAWHSISMWIGNIFHGLELIVFKSKYPQCLILEVGADRPGDIRKIAGWIKPDIAVITRVSDVPVHVEFFASADAVLKEKSYLAKFLRKNGTLILSADDQKLRALGVTASQTRLTFGISTPATVTGTHYSIVYDNGSPSGMSFKLNYEGNSVPVEVKGSIGLQYIYPLIAAAAVGIASKVPLLDIAKSLGEHIPSRGRMNILRGANGVTLIDDTYNSSPDALHEALNTLEKIEIPAGSAGRKIAVLGDMLELGKYSVEEHAKAGEHAHRAASIVISVGQRARAMPHVSQSFDASDATIEYMKSLVLPGDVVLIKGSQSIRMEKIVKALLLDPSKAGELLVRQEPEWLAKK